MLKIRSTPTEAKQTGYMSSQLTEPEIAEIHTPAIPNMVRDCVKENSLENISPVDTLPQAPFDSKSEDKEEITEPLCTDGTASLEIPEDMREALTLQDLKSQQERTLESQPAHLVIFTCKDTIASRSVDYQFENVEPLTLHLILKLYR